MNDQIDLLLQAFSLKARLIFMGNLCDITNFDAGEGVAHIHVLRGGKMDVMPGQGSRLELREPSLLFFPRPTNHRLLPVMPEGADLLCTSIEFGLGPGNPLVQALPPMMIVPCAAAPGLTGVLDVFFNEASGSQQGRTSALRHLAELVLMYTVRYGFEHGQLHSGMMAGLADARLSKALLAIHSRPAEPWTLELMAEQAGMSRARFAAHFNQVTGVPPGDYLGQLRINIAQTLLTKGRPVKQVADEVGYGSSTALTRAFTARTGHSPTAWLLAHTLPTPAANAPYRSESVRSAAAGATPGVARRSRESEE
jgi:AraC-like DNA-binding protein